MRSAGPVGVFLVLALAACTPGAEGSSPRPTADRNAVEVQGTTTTQPCEPEITPLSLDEAPDATPRGLVALSQKVYSCMPTAVVVQGDDLTTVRFASETAVRQNTPLLQLRSPTDRNEIVAELERLGVTDVIAIGVDPTLSSGLGDSVRSEPVPSTTAVVTTVSAPEDSASEPTTTSSDISPTSTAVVDSSTTSTTALTTDVTTTSTAAPPRFDPPPSTRAPSEDGPVVLYRPDSLVAAYLTLPAITAGGGEVVVTDLNDVDSVRALLGGRTDVFTGGDPLTATEEWQVALAGSDAELFGGGTTVFPDRRIVAYYGNPLTFRLGILGETDPERAVERVTERAALYDAEGLPPAPARLRDHRNRCVESSRR